MHLIARIGANRGKDEAPVLVARYGHVMAPVLVIRGGIDFHVRALRRAEFVEIDRLIVGQRVVILALRDFGEARVEESFIAQPLDPAAVFDPFEVVGQLLAGRNVEHIHAVPVRPAVLDLIGDELALLGGRVSGQRGRAVLGPCVRVEQHPPLAIDPVAHEQLRLVREARIVGVEIAIALFARDAEALVIHQLADFALEPCTARQFVEIGIGDGVLRLHPAFHVLVGADRLFEPAIGIGHLLAEFGIDHIVAAGFGVGHVCGRFLCGGSGIIGRCLRTRLHGHGEREQAGGGKKLFHVKCRPSPFDIGSSHTAE